MRAVAPTNVGLPGIAIFRPGRQIKGRRWAPRDSWTNGKDQANRTTAVALAAALGALPLAIGFGDGAELRRPLGIAIIGGLIASQLLTLLTTDGPLRVDELIVDAGIEWERGEAVFSEADLRIVGTIDASRLGEPIAWDDLPAPTVGDRVSLIGTWVDDTQHDWNELHPVWAVRTNSASWHRSGPKYGGSPGYARSRDALSRGDGEARRSGLGAGVRYAGGIRRHAQAGARTLGGDHPPQQHPARPVALSPGRRCPTSG